MPINQSVKQKQLKVLHKQQQAKLKYGFGYRAERGDINDLTKFHLSKPSRFENKTKREIATAFNDKVKIDNVNTSDYTFFDFSNEMTTIRNQKNLGACVRFTTDGITEYYLKTTKKAEVQSSPKYGYKKIRDLMGVTGDTGSMIRTGFKALVTYGWIHEKDYPYDIDTYDEEVPETLEDLGELNQATLYSRVDYTGIDRNQLIDDIQKNIIRKIPVAFGFTCYESLEQADTNGGLIPYPDTHETQIGGHAVSICGFDDELVITNKNGNVKTKGAFKIRNSWGIKGGNNGYYNLPYDYVRDELALDFWTLLDMEWIDLREFDEE